MKYIFIIIFFLLFVNIASASVEYGDGWKKDCQDNGKCSYQNYYTIQKWNGKYIPYSWLNIDNGNWTYNLSQNTTHYNLSKFDEFLVLPKNFANYTFGLTDISLEFTVTPSQLNSKSTANGSGQWYITIPDKAAKTRFVWDNKKPIVSNDTGDILDESNYWYSVVNDKRRLNYNQVARDFGIASQTVTFQFNSWTVGQGGNAWSGNSTFDNVTLTGSDDNNIVVGNEADYFNRANDTNLGSDWAEVGTLSAINSTVMKPSSSATHGVLFQTNFDVNKTILFTYYDFNNTHQDSPRLFINSSASSFTGAVIRMDDTSNVFNLNSVAPSGGSGQDNIVHGNIIRIVVNTTKIDAYIDSYYVGGWNYVSDAGYVGFMNGFAGGMWGFDNFTVYNSTSMSGNLTTWHDSGTGNETYQIDVNASTITNTNYSVYYRQNQTGNMVLLGSAQTGNNSYSLSTKYQDTEINVTLFGNITETPELTRITFWTQVVSGGVTFNQNIYNTGWQTIFINSTQSMTSISGMMNSTNVKWISWWNATSQKWQTFKQGWTYRQNNEATSGDAVYIKFTNNGTITRNNGSGSYNWTTKVNWNLLGLDYNGSRTLSQINTSVNSGSNCDADKIVHYNLETLAESTFTCGQSGNASVAINQGEGFWVNATTAFDRVRSW